MSKDPQNLIDEAQRDIAAARSELRGRADQIAADYDERLNQLGAISSALESGEISTRVAQDRVRQLLGDRGGFARLARGGRTGVGMRSSTQGSAPSPGTPPPPNNTTLRTGPTPIIAAASLNKAQADVDSRVVGTMVARSLRRDEARLELALLAHVRRGLNLVAADIPQDTVLLEGVMEFADEAQTLMTDLTGGGVGRLKRLLDYERELVGQLVAAGANVGTAKEQIRTARAALEQVTPDLKKGLDDILTIFVKLGPESDRLLPIRERSLFDDLLKI